MNFENTIIELLGIQDVVIEDIKRFKKNLRVEIRVRQKDQNVIAINAVCSFWRA